MTEKQYEELICKIALFGERVEDVEYGISSLAKWLFKLLNGDEEDMNRYLNFYIPAFESYDNALYVMSEFLSNYRCGAYKEYGKVTVPSDIADTIYRLGKGLGEFIIEHKHNNKNRNTDATERGVIDKILSLL